jgi:hypothetical protein
MHLQFEQKMDDENSEKIHYIIETDPLYQRSILDMVLREPRRWQWNQKQTIRYWGSGARQRSLTGALETLPVSPEDIDA